MIKLALKHAIYEVCIDLCFRTIQNNFPKSQKRIPLVGEKYSKVVDTVFGEVYLDCTVVTVESMTFFTEMEPDEAKQAVVAIYYRKSVLGGDTVGEDDHQYFTMDELGTMVFVK